MNITPDFLIRGKDVRNCPELWIQKVSVILFTDEQGKPWWTREYKFLPNHERYNQAVKWIRDTEFPEYDCRIVHNGDNEIEIVTRNYFGPIVELEQQEQGVLRRIRKKIGREYRNPSVELGTEQLEPYRKGLEGGFKLTKYEEFIEWDKDWELIEEELAEWKEIIARKGKLSGTENVSYDLGRPDLAILWRKQLYFVSGFEYVDNWKLTVKIKAKKCPLSIYYWNWMRGSGVGYLLEAPIQKENEKMHYEFCGDLSIKANYQQAFSYQPRFALFRIFPSKLTFAKAKTEEEGQESVEIPLNSSYQIFDENQVRKVLKKVEEENENLEKYKVASKKSQENETSREESIIPLGFGGFLRNMLDQKIFLTVGCEEQMKGIIAGNNEERKALYSHFTNGEEILFIKDIQMAEWLKKQPHLRRHATFQFYLFNKIITTGNWDYLGIEERDGKFVLPWKLFISSSPGNLHYRWEFGKSGMINAKLEIKTIGTFEPGFSIFKILRSFSVSGFGFGTSLGWDSDAYKHPAHEKNRDTTTEQEQQTERMFKSILRDPLGKTIEPVNFNSNTIDFNYSLGEFFNRLTSPIFFYRIHVSELLYNRLKWANNKQKILSLPEKWENYGSFSQKLGEWKWRDVKLESDYSEFFKERMEQGYVLTDGSKSGNPDFDYETGNNYGQIAGQAWDIYFAEEEKIEIEVPGEDKQISQAPKDANEQVTKGGAFDTFLEFESQEAFSQFRSNLRGPAVEQLWNTVQGTKISWGRFLTGGADGGNSEWHWNSGWAGLGSEWVADMNTGAGTKIRMKLNNNGGIDEETLRSGDYQIHIKFPSLENIQIWITGGMDKKTIITFGETKKTKSQEIDQAELKNRENEDETFEEQELDLENVEKEQVEQGLGERSQEKEQERETEKEQEFEQEQEQETEQEREEEQEKETEKEREAEREREERERQEREQQEKEEEGEQEEEIEL